MSVVHAELTKFRSVPATAWTLLTTIALTVAFGMLYTMVLVSHPPADPGGFDATAVSLAGVQVAHLAAGVLGVLVITNEYATGLIRTTLAAVPRRTPVLWAKAGVVAAATFALSLPTVLGAFLIGQSMLSQEHLNVSLGQPGAARAVVGGALYLAVVAVLGVGLGTILRRSAGGVVAVFAVLIGPQLLAGFLPAGLADAVYPWLPAPAGLAVTATRPDPALLSPWIGFAVFVGYVLTALALGAWCLRRRDA